MTLRDEAKDKAASWALLAEDLAQDFPSVPSAKHAPLQIAVDLAKMWAAVAEGLWEPPARTRGPR